MMTPQGTRMATRLIDCEAAPVLGAALPGKQKTNGTQFTGVFPSRNAFGFIQPHLILGLSLDIFKMESWTHMVGTGVGGLAILPHLFLKMLTSFMWSRNIGSGNGLLRKIHGMSSVNYWEQLQKLQLYSLQRRRERYISIYIWKMLEGLAPNTSSSGSQHIGSSWHIRHGRLCHIPVVPSRTPGKIKAVRYSSITVRGPRLFNALPRSIRNMTGCTVDLFKKNLDALLRKLPDEPSIPGYSQFRCTSSNSLTDILPYARNHGIIGGSEPIPNEGVLISSGGTP